MAAPSNDPWVFYGSVPWDTPWLNDQQLAHAIAAETPVLYVEPLRSPVSDLRGARRPAGAQRRILLPGLRRREGGVHVLTVVGLPRVRSERMQRLSAPLARAQIRWAIRRLRLGPVAASVGMTPQSRRLKGAARERVFVAFVSDWLEAGADLLGLDREDIVKATAGLWRAADVLCVTSRALEDELRARGFDPQLLPHGFDDTLAPAFDAAPVPDVYETAGSPVMVMSGRLNRRVDVALLGTLADRFENGTVFLVGPVATGDRDPGLERLLERRNVVHVPTQGRDQLPGYLRNADVLLIAYVPDDWIRFSYPMKVWDYLYAGTPMVGYACPALADFPEPIAYNGESHDETCAAVERALAAPDATGVVAQRRELALSNSWRDRAARLRELVAAARR